MCRICKCPSKGRNLLYRLLKIIQSVSSDFYFLNICRKVSTHNPLSHNRDRYPPSVSPDRHAKRTSHLSIFLPDNCPRIRAHTIVKHVLLGQRKVRSVRCLWGARSGRFRNVGVIGISEALRSMASKGKGNMESTEDRHCSLAYIIMFKKKNSRGHCHRCCVTY